MAALYVMEADLLHPAAQVPAAVQALAVLPRAAQARAALLQAVVAQVLPVRLAEPRVALVTGTVGDYLFVKTRAAVGALRTIKPVLVLIPVSILSKRII